MELWSSPLKAFSSLAFNRIGIALTAVLVATCCLQALDRAVAETYPSRPIKLIVPFSAGSLPDAVGRIVADKLSSRLGQNVVIENRPGAGTTIAAKAAAAADPDGYTLFQVNAAFVYGPVRFPDPGYDPLESFSPIASIADWSLLLIVPAALPVATVEELVAYAKANPDRVNIGHTLGSPPEILAKMFIAASGTPFRTVAYREVSQLIGDLISGQIQAFFGGGAGLVSLVQSGKLKALAYTGSERYPALPLVPTVSEAGLPQLALNPTDWTGIVAPAGTPSAVIDKLNEAINDSLRSPDVRERIERNGGIVRITSPSEFAALLTAEAKKWPVLLKGTAVKPN